MRIHFFIRYKSNYGDKIRVKGDCNELGNDDFGKAFSLGYLNLEIWSGTVSLRAPEKNIFYSYFVKNDSTGEIREEWGRHSITLEPGIEEYYCVDSWWESSAIDNAFLTAAFQKVLLPPTPFFKAKPKNSTHLFRVKAPRIGKGKTVCLLGTFNDRGDWNAKKPIVLNKDKDADYYTYLDLSAQDFPLAYKYGIYNLETAQFEKYESGDNRVLQASSSLKCLTMTDDAFFTDSDYSWKGAGVVIPVFSLRTENSFGVGEFNDLKLLIDWAKKTGFRLIQLLPINDTSATNTWTDSYPYASISAFAMHPLYLNIPAIGVIHADDKDYKNYERRLQQLNTMATVDYEEVLKWKWKFIRQSYQRLKGVFTKENEYKKFYSENKQWLVPYAVFCYLRDENKTANFSLWKQYGIYNEKEIAALADEKQEFFDSIEINFFVQYHLHKQLKSASDYAHDNGIVLKGDIPIGIYRYSVDAWVAPDLYHMEQQAGAPPDDFAVKGQNWGFPTYNWDRMEADGFAWWKNRFSQMSQYFDAFRIDHILGFFRIWSIPYEAVEGLLGIFVPALAFHRNEIVTELRWFDEERLCKPFINHRLLEKLFGKDVDYIKRNYLTYDDVDNYGLKPKFNTQRKVNDYFSSLKPKDEDEEKKQQQVKQGLFDLIANVLLIPDVANPGEYFHPRISFDTFSFQQLDAEKKKNFERLYNNYFYERQNEFWRKQGMRKLPPIKRATNMLICGEDLGMIPDSVPNVMKDLGILSLEIQRMPKAKNVDFFHPRDAPYLSVVTPSTHDMSTVRGWWEEDRKKTQKFYNDIMGHEGDAPFYCEPWIAIEIMNMHLNSPAMWSAFQLQDILATSGRLRRELPEDERINVPAINPFYWRYRMHLTLEQLNNEDDFSRVISDMIKAAGRA